MYYIVCEVGYHVGTEYTEENNIISLSSNSAVFSQYTAEHPIHEY